MDSIILNTDNWALWPDHDPGLVRLWPMPRPDTVRVVTVSVGQLHPEILRQPDVVLRWHRNGDSHHSWWWYLPTRVFRGVRLDGDEGVLYYRTVPDDPRTAAATPIYLRADASRLRRNFAMMATWTADAVDANIADQCAWFLAIAGLTPEAALASDSLTPEAASILARLTDMPAAMVL